MISNFSFSDSTLGFILEGEVNEVTINRFIVQIEEKWETHDKINLYLEDSNVESYSVGAVVNEIAFKLGNADRFLRIAIVADKKWINACAALQDLFLTAEVKSFGCDKRLEALAWVSQSAQIDS